MYKHMGKVVIKILQDSAVTLTTLGGLSIHPAVANFIQCICAKNCENWLTVDKVIAKIIGLLFWPTLYICWLTVMCKSGWLKSRHVTLFSQLRLFKLMLSRTMISENTKYVLSCSLISTPRQSPVCCKHLEKSENLMRTGKCPP